MGASVAANPNNAISATVTLTATGYDSVFVRFWHDSVPAQRTPSTAFLAESTLTLPVLGLDTAAGYSFEDMLERKGKKPRAADTLAFTSGSLPAWIPVVGTVGTDTLPGYLLLSLPNGPVIVDNLGKVVWYRFRPGGVLGSWTGQPNGTYTWLSAADSSGYYVHDVLGEETGRLACVGYKTRFHDVLVQATGDVWIMCDEETIEDLTAYGGIDTAKVTSTVVQHLDPSGQVAFQWRSIDHLSFAESDPSLLTGAAVNFVQFAEDLRATPTKFTFQNDVPVRNYFNLGTGLVMVLPNGWQPFVNFRAMVGNEQFTNYAGTSGCGSNSKAEVCGR